MRWWPIAELLSVLLLAVSFSSPLNAQTTTSGALAGVVTDPSDAVMPDAVVEIRDLAKGTTQSTRTGRDGLYQFFFLAPSKYVLTVTHPGFQTETRTVNVLLGPPVTVNVALAIAKASTYITVVADAALVQAENGDVSATVTQKQISELPNPGNDLTYVVQTAPGVIMNTDVQGGANFSILGMPGSSYLHTMDGMSDNDNGVNLSMVGPLLLLLGQNQVQETAVVTTGYSGQFGGAAGGNINYITKSGGNELHGNLQYYWNGRAFNANNWFNNTLNQPRPFSIANQWAGSLGGPIKRKKLFFFFDTEGLRLLIPQQFLVTIPSPRFETATLSNLDSKFGSTSASHLFYAKMFDLYKSAPGASSAEEGGFDQKHDPLGCSGFVDPNDPNGLGTTLPCARHFIENRGRPSQDAVTSGRMDWNINSSDRAFLRVQYDRGRAAFGTNPISPLFDVDSTDSWWQAQMVETHTFGSSAANQFLLGGSYFEPVFRVRDLSSALVALPTTLNFVSGGFDSLGAGDNFHGYIGQYQVAEDLAKTWGHHKFGFGTNLVRIFWNRSPNLAGTIGQLSVQNLYAFYQGGVDGSAPDDNFTSLFRSFTSETRLRVSFANFGFYGGDEWRVRPNLTLTLALRAERYSNPACENYCFARLARPFSSLSHDPNQSYQQAILVNQKRAFAGTDSILWSPRFSFAWQPFRISRNTVIRGGAGIFYDPLPGLIVDSFSGNPPLYNSYSISGNNLAPGEISSLFEDAKNANAAFVQGFTSGQTLDQIRTVDANFSPPAISVSERRTHSSQYQRWSLEVQQVFGADTSVNIGYYGHHGIHELVLNPNANAFGFGSLPATVCTSPPIPPCADPRFSGVTQINTNAVSNYSGIVASFRHGFRGHWSQGLLQANYTYGHAFDESSGFLIFTGASLPSPQDPNNLRGSYGSADHDVRHSFNANYVWDLPIKAVLGGRGWDFLTNGWQVAGTLFARTGFPYTVFDVEQSGSLVPNNYFGLLYAIPVGLLGSGPSCGKGAAVPLALHPCQIPQVLARETPNPSARFLQSGCATGFNTGKMSSLSGSCDGPVVSFAQGRNRFRGPGYFNTDFTITKNTKLPGWENATLGIGFQFFNLFNHPNFGFPDAGLSSSTFGQIFGLEQPPTGILGSGLGANSSPRMIQLKAQIQF